MTNGSKCDCSGIFRHIVGLVLRLTVLVVLLCAARLGRAQTETILYSFAGGTDGSYPYAGLVQDSGGNFYGTTTHGGASDCGIIFQVTASGQETILYSFSGPDGAYPWAGLLLDAEGNLYGTTTVGGAYGYGTVFELTPGGTYRLLHSFDAKDGASPHGGVIQDAKGNLYGTTAFGGSSRYGTVFKLKPSGGLKVLYSFTGGKDGGSPYAGVVRDAEGHLYGTTTFDGAFGNGTVFRVSASGKEKVLHSFKGQPDGATPYAGLLQDAKGNLYGTTYYGGSGGDAGVGGGTVFRVTPSGKEKVLYSFCSILYCPDGVYPYGGVVADASGNVYGTTITGGNSQFGASAGTVFEVTPAGTETLLYSFSVEGADGNYPYGALVQDANGNLFGTTLRGGAYGVGTVFEVTP
jgi:uncharacterized repeat protein (TIGR03803 family)